MRIHKVEKNGDKWSVVTTGVELGLSYDTEAEAEMIALRYNNTERYLMPGWNKRRGPCQEVSP